MFLFDIFDAFLAVWQQLLTTLAYHPWLPIVILPLMLIVDMGIKKYDKIKYPND